MRAQFRDYTYMRIAMVPQRISLVINRREKYLDEMLNVEYHMDIHPWISAETSVRETYKQLYRSDCAKHKIRKLHITYHWCSTERTEWQLARNPSTEGKRNTGSPPVPRPVEVAEWLWMRLETTAASLTTRQWKLADRLQVYEFRSLTALHSSTAKTR